MARFDIEFPAGQLPDIYNAVTIKDEDKLNITLETMQHLGNNTVRCVALSSTDGLQRGMTANDQGHPIAVPVGRPTLGRMMSVIGDPIDGMGPIDVKDTCRFTGLLRLLKTGAIYRNFGNSIR